MQDTEHTKRSNRTYGKSQIKPGLDLGAKVTSTASLLTA